MSDRDAFAEVCDDRDNALRVARDAIAERDAAAARADHLAELAASFGKSAEDAAARADKAEGLIEGLRQRVRACDNCHGVGVLPLGVWAFARKNLSPPCPKCEMARAALGEEPTP